MAALITYGAHTYGKIQPIGVRQGQVVVGKYCSIAKQVSAFFADDHNHEVISTFPFGHREMGISKLMRRPKLPETRHYNLEKPQKITIGNDVWLGYGAILFRNVTIGNGAVIGAFARITKNIPPYAVVVGDSRILKKRFSDQDIAFLQELQWWDFDDQTVADIAPILHTSDVGVLRQWARDNGRA